MTGEISASVRRMWDDDAASRKLGMELHEAVDGRARLTMTVTDEMVNGHGMCHGGYLFLLADSAFACACNSPGPVTVAAAADIVFVASARTADVLEAVATERTSLRAQRRLRRHGLASPRRAGDRGVPRPEPGAAQRVAPDRSRCVDRCPIPGRPSDPTVSSVATVRHARGVGAGEEGVAR